MRVFVLLFLVLFTTSFPQKYGHWEFTDTMRYARATHSSTILDNGNVLVAGGAGGTDSAANTAEIFDPYSQQWSLVASPNDQLGDYSLISIGNNKAIAFGVYKRRACEIYDANTNQWYYTDSLSLYRSQYSVSKLKNSKILVAGGWHFTFPHPLVLASCEIFHPLTETWSYTDSLNLARWQHRSTLLKDGNVLVTGGQLSNGYKTRSCELYNPVLDQWSIIDSMPGPKVVHGIITLPTGDVLVSGGDEPFCYLYDISTKEWKHAGQMYWWRYDHVTIPLSDSVVMFLGGGVGNSDATWEIYNPYKGQTLFYDSLTIGNFYPTAHTLSNGTILNIGGFTYDNGNIQSKKECLIFYPKTTGLVTIDNALLEGFELEQNYPNPFNPATKIRFVIPNEVRNLKDFSSQAPRNDNPLVVLKVYDVLGNKIATLVDEYKPAGSYEVEFSGEGLPSGVYFYKLQTDNFVETKKMILLR